MSNYKIRKPAVSGKFYPNSKNELLAQLNEIREKELPSIDLALSHENIIGAVVPHAGFMFSAYQAIHFFEIIKNSNKKIDTFFIINPNHTGYGAEVSMDENDFWETPFGKAEIDKEFYKLMDFSYSSEAHRYEHSGEVMIPLLQYSLNYDFKIVPITLSRQNLQNAKHIAASIYNANKKLNRNICIIASSDFSHFLHPTEGKKLDQFVIDGILDLNSQTVEEEVNSKNISVCGYGPIMTLIEYSKLVSKNPKTKILKRGHSGEIIPSDEVVDYVSILFYQSNNDNL